MAALGVTPNIAVLAASTLGATTNTVDHAGLALGQNSNTVEFAGSQSATFSSRISGIAPLAVVFSAVDITGYVSGVIQPGDLDYARVWYEWNFGDAGSGTWATSGKSKNTDIGYVACHVYETPGNYTITLTVKSSDGVSRVYTENITVSAFSGTTYYISNLDGDDNDDGLTEGTAWKTLDKAFQNIATNRRFLFNRGDTFTTTSTKTISVDGPGIFGEYGSGALPIWQRTTSGNTLVVSADDWRIMDIDFDGQFAGASGTGVSLPDAVPTQSNLFLRLNIHDYSFVPLGWSHFGDVDTTPQDSIVIAECTFVLSPGLYNLYLGGKRYAIVGNTLNGVTSADSGHTVRAWQSLSSVIAHNDIKQAGNHAIKFHGPSNTSGMLPSKYASIHDNELEGRNAWTVAIGPQDSISDERVEQVIVENNHFYCGIQGAQKTQVDCIIWARQITCRNNVHDGSTGSNNWTAVRVAKRGIEPAPINVRIYNESAYKSDAGTTAYIVAVTSDDTDVLVRNCLGSAPNVTTDAVINGTCPGLVNENNNMTDTPGWTDPANDDFTLAAGSVAINAGQTLVEVRKDRVGVARPQGAAYDLGSYEKV